MSFGKTKEIYFWAEDLNRVTMLMRLAKFELSCERLLRMPMHADNGRADHRDSRHHGWQQVHLYTGPPPANKAVVASGAGTKRFR